jgi:hypothetical protein
MQPSSNQNNQNVTLVTSQPTPSTILSAMPKIPLNTTTQPSTQTSSNLNPAIVQLQKSLQESTKRIDTIQEMTTSRFSSIQEEFLKTQNSLASILQNGLNDINKQ